MNNIRKVNNIGLLNAEINNDVTRILEDSLENMIEASRSQRP